MSVIQTDSSLGVVCSVIQTGPSYALRGGWIVIQTGSSSSLRGGWSVIQAGSSFPPAMIERHLDYSSFPPLRGMEYNPVWFFSS